MTHTNRCEYAFCPGHHDIPPADVAHQLAVYGATRRDPRWETVLLEALCLVRRQRPRNSEAAKKMLVSARGLVCAQAEAPESLRDALTTTRIEQYLRHLGAKNASNQRALLMYLMADAHGLPTARPRKRQAQSAMSAAVEGWMRQCESGVPMREVLGNGCTRDSLRALTPHLPSGDIPGLREVLRG